jgi:hypothetical protein
MKNDNKRAGRRDQLFPELFRFKCAVADRDLLESVAAVLNTTASELARRAVREFCRREAKRLTEERISHA